MIVEFRKGTFFLLLLGLLTTIPLLILNYKDSLNEDKIDYFMVVLIIATTLLSIGLLFGIYYYLELVLYKRPYLRNLFSILTFMILMGITILTKVMFVDDTYALIIVLMVIVMLVKIYRYLTKYAVIDRSIAGVALIDLFRGKSTNYNKRLFERLRNIKEAKKEFKEKEGLYVSLRDIVDISNYKGISYEDLLKLADATCEPAIAREVVYSIRVHDYLKSSTVLKMTLEEKRNVYIKYGYDLNANWRIIKWHPFYKFIELDN